MSKKLIKQICSEASEQTEKVGEKRARETSKENLGRSKTERAFFLMLLRELAKVNNHYVQQYKEIEARLTYQVNTFLTIFFVGGYGAYFITINGLCTGVGFALLCFP